MGPLEGLQHQPGPLVRVPRLGAVAVVMLDPAAPGGLGVIRDGLLRLPEGTAGEIRPEGPWFHHHNLDAQGGHLLLQRAGQALQGAFGGPIVPGTGEGVHRRNGGDVDNGPCPLPAHVGEHRLDEGHGAKEVGLEETVHLLRGPLLHSGPVAVAGVVDEAVNAAQGADDVVHHLLDLVPARHVQGQGHHLPGVLGLE